MADGPGHIVVVVVITVNHLHTVGKMAGVSLHLVGPHTETGE